MIPAMRLFLKTVIKFFEKMFILIIVIMCRYWQE